MLKRLSEFRYTNEFGEDIYAIVDHPFSQNPSEKDVLLLSEFLIENGEILPCIYHQKHFNRKQNDDYFYEDPVIIRALEIQSIHDLHSRKRFCRQLSTILDRASASIEQLSPEEKAIYYKLLDSPLVDVKMLSEKMYPYDSLHFYSMMDLHQVISTYGEEAFNDALATTNQYSALANMSKEELDGECYRFNIHSRWIIIDEHDDVTDIFAALDATSIKKFLIRFRRGYETRMIDFCSCRVPFTGIDTLDQAYRVESPLN